MSKLNCSWSQFYEQFSSILKVAKYQKVSSNLLAQLARIGWKFRHEKIDDFTILSFDKIQVGKVICDQ